LGKRERVRSLFSPLFLKTGFDVRASSVKKSKRRTDSTLPFSETPQRILKWPRISKNAELFSKTPVPQQVLDFLWG
jgi:hypothetical protein